MTHPGRSRRFGLDHRSAAARPGRDVARALRALGLPGRRRPVRDASFQATVASRTLPHFDWCTGRCQPSASHVHHRYVADGPDDLGFVVDRGAIAAIARDRGGATRRRCRADERRLDRRVRRSTSGGSISIRIPRVVLSSLVVDLDDVVVRLAHGPRRSRVADQLRAPVDGEDALRLPRFGASPSPTSVIVTLTLGATRDAGGVAQVRGTHRPLAPGQGLHRRDG